MIETIGPLILACLIVSAVLTVGVVVNLPHARRILRSYRSDSPLATSPIDTARAVLQRARESDDKRLERWRAVADRLDGDLQETHDPSNLPLTAETDGGDVRLANLRLTAQIEGVDVRLDAPNRTGDGSGALVSYRADVSEVVPAGFEVHRQTTPPLLESLDIDSVDDVPSGNPALDRTFRFFGDDRDDVQEFLWREPVTEALERLAVGSAPIALEEGHLVEHAPMRSPEEAVATIRELADIARTLGRPTDDETADREQTYATRWEDD